MKVVFGGFDHFRLLSKFASHGTLTTGSCQQASSIHQNVGRSVAQSDCFISWGGKALILVLGEGRNRIQASESTETPKLSASTPTAAVGPSAAATIPASRRPST